MATIHESDIEQSLIDLLIMQGYDYYYGPDIAPFSTNPKRIWFDSVVLEQELKDSLQRLNPHLPESARHEAFEKIMHLWSMDIMTNNQSFHTMLCNGVTVEYTKTNDYGESATQWIIVRLLDMESIENNSFRAVNQFVIKENNKEKRLDVVIFVNWLPLVVVELKNALDENATIEKAFTQITNYKTAIPSIFYYNALCIVSDWFDARVSSVSAPFGRYLPRKSPNKKEHHLTSSWIQIMTSYMLEKQTLLRLIRYNTVFEQEEVKDEKSWLYSVTTIKKVAAYHQYYAVQKAVEHTIRATDEQHGNRKIWIIRHTQWSWKSLSMVFYTGQIVTHPLMKNPTILVITDRNDLDDQLFTTYSNCIGLLRQTPVQANSTEHLKQLLQVSWWGIIFSTIQKFHPEEGNIFQELSDRHNIVVIADEAHRSQYGFHGKEVEIYGEDGEKTGSVTKYGNAKYLRDALPNASFIGFTWTPIETSDKSTRNVFGSEIDIYDIKQAVDDGATVPLSYESRLIKIKFNKEVTEKIDSLIEDITDATPEQIEKAKKKNAQIDAIVWHPERLSDVARDIIDHFEKRKETFDGKAMIVCMTRDIAVRLYDQIISYRPDRHSDDLNSWVIKVVMTSSSDDPSSFQAHATSKEQRKHLATRLKDPNDSLKLVIVRDMRLTGFDAPCLHTMYIDKKMKWANLMQAIARVNRVYKWKPWWLIVDYIGIGQDLRDAMKIYTDSGWQWNGIENINVVIQNMMTKFEVVEAMFHGYPFQEYFKASTQDKLTILLGASDHILSDEKLKQRFLHEIVLLSKLYAMAVPSYESEQIRDYVAFFQWVKARISKITQYGVKTDTEVETAIKQIVDDALATDGVIDIFQAAWIKSPDISILSEEFLADIKNMKAKHIAFELLKRLLNNEVGNRKKTNIVQAKKFSEMLQNTIKKYHNNQIDTAQVIQELTEIAKEMRLDDNNAHELWLTKEEYAFYTILSENSSTKFLEDDDMKKLIRAIIQEVKNTTATSDRERREDVRASLRLSVKKILMRYGYPPDIARMEADRVLEQSELLAQSDDEKNMWSN